VHLAQANLSLLRHPPSAPQVAEYVAALERINQLANRAPGFVWRQRTAVSADERLVLNLSVWRSYQPLHDYTYRSAHGHFVRRRHEWFDRVPQPSTVLWWIPAGTHPTVEEGLARLRHLRRHGPTPKAFSLRVRFDPAGHRDQTRHSRTQPVHNPP
jgi:heme-degrading monooxygenase HmoA